MSFDVNVLSTKPVIKAAASMQNDGGAGNLGYMAQGEKEEKKEKSDILGIITLIKEVYKQLKKDILNLLDYIICHAIKIKELNVSSKFGTGNPMYTGIATGAVNAGVYNAVGWIDRRMKLEKWDVSLDADFNNACLDMDVYCKLRTNCLYVLTIGFKTVKVVLKIQKINRRIKENG